MKLDFVVSFPDSQSQGESMKRDMDLVRKILFEIESRPDTGVCFEVQVSGVPQAAVFYHVRLMAEAGLIEAMNLTTDDLRWEAVRLTWQGHEFLDAARDDTVWNKGMELAKKTSGSLAFEGLKAVLIKLASLQIGL